MLPSYLYLEPHVQSLLAACAEGIDHVGIAVRDIEEALPFYSGVLGLSVVERRETLGRRTSMCSAVLAGGPLTFVLVQGNSPESQVTRFIEKYGSGVQHIAIRVSSLPDVMENLKARGLEFVTSLIRSKGLLQAFSVRDPRSGVMLELIERTNDEELFVDDNVDQLYQELEASDHF